MPSINRILFILQYLWNNTDENHTVSLSDISKYLATSGLPKPDARTLRNDINQLIEFGIDIMKKLYIINDLPNWMANRLLRESDCPLRKTSVSFSKR